MSTDYYVVCDKNKTYCHLGVRFASGSAFANGTSDVLGHRFVMDYIVNNCSDGLRIVSDSDTTVNLCEYTEEEMPDESGKRKALDLAYSYGQIGGDHHKAWVIDQMVRAMLGSSYDSFIRDYEQGGEYSWDEGIAP